MHCWPTFCTCRIRTTHCDRVELVRTSLVHGQLQSGPAKSFVRQGQPIECGHHAPVRVALGHNDVAHAGRGTVHSPVRLLARSGGHRPLGHHDRLDNAPGHALLRRCVRSAATLSRVRVQHGHRGHLPVRVHQRQGRAHPLQVCLVLLGHRGREHSVRHLVVRQLLEYRHQFGLDARSVRVWPSGCDHATSTGTPTSRIARRNAQDSLASVHSACGSQFCDRIRGHAGLLPVGTPRWATSLAQQDSQVLLIRTSVI